MKREDMKSYAKFRVTCATCGKRQPRATTDVTCWNWMRQHEQQHRAEEMA